MKFFKPFLICLVCCLLAGVSYAQGGLEIDSTSTDTTPSIEKIHGPLKDLEAVAISPTGKLLAAGGWDNRVYIYSLEKDNRGALITALEHHSSAILSLSFDMRGQYLACGSNDHQVSVWRVDSVLKKAALRQSGSVNKVVYGPAFPYVYSTTKGGEIKFWNIKDKKRTRSIDLQAKVNSFVMAKNRRSFYVAFRGMAIKQYNLKGVEIGSLEGHEAFVNDLCVSKNGALLASASDDGTVRIWDLMRNKEKFKLEGHATKVIRVVMSSDNQHVFSADKAGTVIQWNANTGEKKNTWTNLGGSIRDISLSRYMNELAVVSYEKNGAKPAVYIIHTGLLNTKLSRKRDMAKRKEAENEWNNAVDEMLEE